MTVVVKIPQFDVPRPRLLDIYVARQYLRVFVLALVGLLGVFYISTFIDRRRCGGPCTVPGC